MSPRKSSCGDRTSVYHGAEYNVSVHNIFSGPLALLNSFSYSEKRVLQKAVTGVAYFITSPEQTHLSECATFISRAYSLLQRNLLISILDCHI